VDLLVELQRNFREGSAAPRGPGNNEILMFLELAVSQIIHSVAIYMQFERVSAALKRG
jgi:hypothetical protein